MLKQVSTSTAPLDASEEDLPFLPGFAEQTDDGNHYNNGYHDCNTSDEGMSLALQHLVATTPHLAMQLLNPGANGYSAAYTTAVQDSTFALHLTAFDGTGQQSAAATAVATSASAQQWDCSLPGLMHHAATVPLPVAQQTDAALVSTSASVALSAAQASALAAATVLSFSGVTTSSSDRTSSCTGGAMLDSSVPSSGLSTVTSSAATTSSSAALDVESVVAAVTAAHAADAEALRHPAGPWTDFDASR